MGVVSAYLFSDTGAGEDSRGAVEVETAMEVGSLCSECEAEEESKRESRLRPVLLARSSISIITLEGSSASSSFNTEQGSSLSSRVVVAAASFTCVNKRKKERS